MCNFNYMHLAERHQEREITIWIMQVILLPLHSMNIYWGWAWDVNLNLQSLTGNKYSGDYNISSKNYKKCIQEHYSRKIFSLRPLSWQTWKKKNNIYFVPEEYVFFLPPPYLLLFPSPFPLQGQHPPLLLSLEFHRRVLRSLLSGKYAVCLAFSRLKINL